MLFACFATKLSLDAALQEQRHTVWVLGQSKAGIQACSAINKKDDDRRGAFKIAQKAIGEVMRGKEESMLGQKRKHQAMDELLPSLDKKTVESFNIASQMSGSKELDAKIASLFYEKAIPFNVAAPSSFALMIDESIKFARHNPLQSYRVPDRHKWTDLHNPLYGAFQRPRASETGLLIGTSTQRSATGSNLKPLRNLSTFTQTAKWWRQLAMPTH
jgi:hypothetical protein